MKTTKQRLFNIIITMSVAVNLVLLVGISYLAMMDIHVKQVYTAMNTPVVVYAPKVVEASGDATLVIKPAAAQ